MASKIIDPFATLGSGIVDPFAPPPAAEPAPKPAGYGARAALGDIGVSAAQGAVNLIGAGGALVDSATGGRVSRALAPAESSVRSLLGGDATPRGLTASADEASQTLQPLKSERLQQSEGELASTEGFLASAKKVLTDPVLLLSQAGQQVPIVAATMLGARGGARAGAAQAEARVAERLGAGVKPPPSAAAIERYTRKSAQAGAENAVLASGGAMGGGFSAQQAVQGVMAMPDDVLGADPEYQQLLASGMSPADARQQRAYDAGLAAAPIGAGANLVAGRLTAGLEARAFTGAVPNGGLGGLLSAQGARGVASAVGREGLEEGITEGAETFGGNLGMAQVDPTQGLMEGVPEASGAAAVMGGVMGGGIQTAGTIASPGQRSSAPAQGESAAADALRAPVPTQQEVVDIDPAAGPLSRAVATEAAIQTGSPTVEPVRVTTPIARAADLEAAQKPAEKPAPAKAPEAAEPADQAAAPVGMDPNTGEIDSADQQIRDALSARAGTIIDAQQVRAIAASLGVPVQRVSEARRAMREKERQTAAAAASTQESSNEDVQPRRDGARINERPAATDDSQGQTGQEKGRKEGQEEGQTGQAAGRREARSQGREENGTAQQEAGKYAADDESGTLGRRVSVDETPEQQDGDILPPSGSPYSIRAAAEMATRRHPGSKVIELEDGGFVVRPPKEVPRGTEKPKSASSVEQAAAPSQEVRPDQPIAGAGNRAAAEVESTGSTSVDVQQDGTDSGLLAQSAPGDSVENAVAPTARQAEVGAPAWDRNLKAARAEAVSAGVDWKGKGLSKLVAEVKAAREAKQADIQRPSNDTASRRTAAVEYVRAARARGVSKVEDLMPGISGGRSFNTQPGQKKGHLDVDGEQFSLKELWAEAEPKTDKTTEIAGRGHSKEVRELDVRNRTAGLSDFGLNAVVKKEAGIAALRREAGLTVKAANAAWQEIERDGLKPGLVARARMVDAISRAQGAGKAADGAKPALPRAAESSADVPSAAPNSPQSPSALASEQAAGQGSEAGARSSAGPAGKAGSGSADSDELKMNTARFQAEKERNALSKTVQSHTLPGKKGAALPLAQVEVAELANGKFVYRSEHMTGQQGHGFPWSRDELDTEAEALAAAISNVRQQASKVPRILEWLDGLDANPNSGAGKADRAPPRAGKNTVFTADAADAARKLLKSKLGQLNSGIDPEVMQAGITLAGYHIEKGARTFAAYGRAMIADLGEVVRPYLKSWYMGVKFDPRAAAFDGMDSAVAVESADVNNLEDRRRDGAAREAADAAEDPQAEIARLRAQLDTDSLTTTRSREAYRRDHPSAKGVVFIDLVAFKGYNTKFTETGGDQILTEFGRVMVEVGGTAAYRRGGDEFALLSDQSPEHAAKMAERLQAAMAKVVIEMTDKQGDAYEVKGIPFRTGVGATDEQAVADNARRKEAGDREDNPNAQRKRTDQNDVGAASPGAIGGNENQPGAVAPAESEQAKNYREWLAENQMPPGMRDVINMDASLNDGEAEAILAEVDQKQNPQETPNGTDSDPVAGAADGEQSAQGKAAGSAQDDGGQRRAGELFGPTGKSDSGKDRSAGRSKPGAASSRVADPKGAGNQGDSGYSGRAGVGGTAVDGKPGSRNYVVPVGGLSREGSWLESGQRNVAAMALALKLEEENRLATPEEQALLSRYVGFGSTELANKLFPSSAGDARNYNPAMIVSPAWRALGEKLKATLNSEQLGTVMKSTQYAHYTAEPVTRGIWGAVERMGFKGGKVFEPGMGHGAFPMTAPTSIKNAIAYTGIEMDHMTALIGRQLMQGGLVLRADFTKQKLPNDSFDLVIGNPPFSQTVITADPDYRQYRFMLHDYFFAKALDKLRPGGVLAFVTSAGTMNKGSEKARQYMADRADLLGAVRLPDTAFSQNAGTDVVTDVIFLRKRLPGEAPAGEAWMGLEEVQARIEDSSETKPALVNEYFAKHPDMVLGEHTLIGSRFSDRKYNVSLRDGEILDDLLAKALQRLPAGTYTPAEVRRDRARVVATAEVDLSPDNRKEGGLYVKDGRVMVTRDGAGNELAGSEKLSPREERWLIDAIALRDALKATLSDQRANDPNWQDSLRALESAYTAFVAKHGAINEFAETERVQRYYLDEYGDEFALKEGQEPPEGYEAQERTLVSRRYKNKRLLALDVEAPLLMALEVETDEGRMVGARQLKERSIAPPAEPRIESTTDALLVSLNRKGFLDIDQIAELAGVSQEQAVKDLGDRVYQNPVDGSWTMADAYLSGDVVTALEEAEAAARTNPAYNRNVDALRAVQPRTLMPRDITVGLGATWIPNSVVNEFAKDVLSVNRFGARYDGNSGQWKNGSNRTHSERMDGPYSHTARSASEILDAVLNNRELKVTKTVIGVGGSKTTTTDVEATTAVNEIAKRMRSRFSEWVWEDADRAQDLAATYNTLRNRIIPRTFNGDFIDPPGLAIMFRPDENGRGGLHPHQKRAIWRQVQSGTTYLNHAVGAGKTLEMIIGGMEQKRLGLISKPLYTVPNHVLGQFAAEFLEAYPTANIMVADEESFTGARRRQFIAQATVNNPDAIIMSHSAFGLLRVKPETMEAVVSDMIDDLVAAIDDTAETDRIGRKRLEQQLESLRQKVESKADGSRKDDVVFFEDIGADYLYVDEAHEFRKLDFVTNRTNVKGISAQGSAKALDLYAKIRHLYRQRPGRSHTLASGTAVTNTMGELYTVQKYMDYDAMRAAGLHHFDAWATEYGEVATEYERNAAGQYRPVERFSKFNNIPELMQQVLERMDVLTSSQLGGLVKRPDVDGGKPQMVVVPASPALADYMQKHLAKRIEVSLKWKPSKAQPHNPDPMLAIIGDARLAVIDMRFVDRTAPNDPNSKLNHMIDAVAERFHEFADTKFPGLEGPGATQIVFSPIGFGEGVAKNRGFDARAWMLRRLHEQGVPREQIAFMGDYPTNRKRKALFREMRAGRVRILIGSPKNMGTGVNVQNRLRSLHFLSPPWFPSDVEQPHGRIVRQGNLNGLVDLNWYVTEGTYDATGWGMVARKGRFIEQVFQADRSVRSLEDISEVSQYAMASALASGDDRAIRVAELEADIGRLDNLWGDHQSGTSKARSNVFYAKNAADSLVKKLAAAETAVAAVGDTRITADSFALTLNGKPVPGDSRTEIALAYSGKLRQSIPGASRLAVMNGFEEEIGRVQGDYPLIVSARPGAGDSVYVSMDIQIADLRMSVFDGMKYGDLPSSDTGALGLSTRLINAVNSVSELPERYTRELAKAREQVEQAERRAAAPFPQERELFEKQAELAQLQRDMAQETAPTAAIADAEAAEATPVAALSRPEPARARDSTQFVVGPIDLERRVARIMKNWRGDIPTVRVVESAGRLPADARREDGWEQAEGWYDGRSTIYLVANNLANLSRADQVLAHEAFGHYGVEGVVGKDQWIGIIADVAKLRAKPGTMRADMRAALASTERRYGTQPDAVFAREFLAVMAERGVQSGLMGRVLGAVRRWLRALGFKTDRWAAEEVREVVAKGMRQVRDPGAGPRPGSGRGTAMSAPERARTDTPAFKAWFGDSKVVDADGKPLVVYHGTAANFEAFKPGSYFTASQKQAAQYARNQAEGGGSARLIPAYLSLRNPKIVSDDYIEWAGMEADERAKLQAQGFDGMMNDAKTEIVAFRPEQIKSVDNSGAFNPSDARMAFSLQDPGAASDAIVSRFKEPGNGIVDRIKGKLEDWKPATLGVLTLRQLAEVADSYLPEGSAYVDLMTRMATRRNVLQAESADVAQKWEKMQRDDRRKATAADKASRHTASDRTVDLMHDATLAGTDPAEAYQPSFIRLNHNGDAVSLDAESGAAAIARLQAKLADRAWAKETPDAVKNTMRGDIARIEAGMKTEAARAAAHPALVRRWNALPAPWQTLYREVRDAYSARAEAFQNAMLAQIEALEMAERDKAALRTRVRNHFEAARVEAPYFPLARFGEFWASVEKPGNEDGEIERQFIMAESQRDRDRMIAEAEREGWKLAKKGRKIENIRAQDGASGAFVSDVISTLGAAGVGEKVQDAVYQLYLRTLPDLSTRKQFIHRKKVAGYDADALRAFAGQMNHGAHQLARLEFSQKMGDTVTSLEKSAKALQDEASEDADRASAAVNEFKRRHDWVMNPTNADWVSKVSAFNFVFYLGVSPAAAAVNMTQTAIISYPALAARYGWGKALAMTTAAMRDTIRTGGKIEKTLKNDDERRAYQQLVDMGAIDVTQAHDLAGLGDSPTQDYNARLHRAMNAVSFLFHKAEVFNREATGMAAYRLAREAGESHADALKRAEDTIWQTHYDYSNANRARFMQGNAAKVLFAFKQYSQNTTYYLWRAFYESMKGETPEVKRIARQRLLGTLGMTAVFSGSLGLPLVSVVFGTANLMAALFGDDDEPWDAETEFRNFLADMMPPALARIASGGLVEGGLEAAGLPAPEIGSRTSLNDLWFRAPNQEMEGRDLWHYILEQVAGPVGGIFGGGISGASLIGEGLATGNEGHIWRGFESMMPKVVRDTMKALRYETHGINTLRGDPLIEDVGVIEGIYQALGFMPAEVSEQYDRKSAVKGYEDAVGARKKVLLDAYALTATERDVEGIRATVAKIREFNRAHPGAAINTKTLRRSMQSRQKFSERAMNGIAVSPKLRGELSQRLRFAFEDDGEEAPE